VATRPSASRSTTHRKGETNYPLTILKAAPLSALFYGLLVVAGNLICYVIFGDYTKLAMKVMTGLQLLALWLVVTSTVRTLHSLASHFPAFWLLLAGAGTAILSIVAAPIVMSMIRGMGVNVGPIMLEAKRLTVYLLAGGFFALIALIHLRVRNKALGNTLEWVIIIFMGILFYRLYIAQDFSLGN
jgi:uncharacterized membrane protein HdeD (DUF308 family)